MKNLRKAYLRVTVETQEQFDQACVTPTVDLIYVDSGFFCPEAFADLTAKAHKGTGGFGKLIGLRMPQVWRNRTEDYFERNSEKFLKAGFDVFLAGNPEEVLWLQEKEVSGETVILDHSVYRFNELSETAVDTLCRIPGVTKTWPLELNCRELEDLSCRLKSKETKNELVVYGRANLMVTAQCIRKTSIGCDRRPSLLWLKDRTGALMPVKNCCSFCCSTIYNSVPTVLYDLEKEIGLIAPDSVRYEFTTENRVQMKEILSGSLPVQYTRGHFKRGVL